jgi:putative salt-induced outer membrane protein YdiY
LRICALSVVLAGALSAHADVAELTNGDRISGTVVSVAGGNVVMDTEYAGRLIIDIGAVARLETESVFEMRLSDGSLRRGQFAPDDDAQGVLLEGGEVAPLALADIRNASENKLGLTSLGREWSNRADLGAVVSRGNTETDNYSALVETKLKRDTVEHAFSLLIAQEESDGETTKDQLDFNYGYKRFVSEKWYASGNGQYFRDDLKNIESRITVGAGMGYQFWNNSLGALSSELGLSYVMEELDGNDEANPAIRWGLDYNRFLWSQRLEYFYKHSLLVIPVDGRGQIYNGSTGLRLAMNSWLDTSFRVGLQHETEPADDAEKTDVTYSLGIGIKF